MFLIINLISYFLAFVESSFILASSISYWEGSTKSISSNLGIKTCCVTLPIPAPQSNALDYLGNWMFNESRKATDYSTSLSWTTPYPPKTPLIDTSYFYNCLILILNSLIYIPVVNLFLISFMLRKSFINWSIILNFSKGSALDPQTSIVIISDFTKGHTEYTSLNYRGNYK